ncbi:energy-coupling factor transporter transmembrane component T [uncultured Gulosibacter sp.]|uniref:energy-coupling factor transporter transmembrane component T family protein n=1 Tax=uncultured Gulosibacter sp. TaxID=1339167 RepID=UPI00288AC573|nr:energy-coupling factor transporter transmembrane component T [uncultured Gulosibacter sp.]
MSLHHRHAPIERPTVRQAEQFGLPYLHRLHPLAKLIPTTLTLVALFFTNDLYIPLLVGAITILLLVTGAQLSGRMWLVLLLGIPAVTLVLAVTIGLWVDPARVADTPLIFAIGTYEFRFGALVSGLITSARLAAIVVLALLSGLTTAGTDLIRASVQQLRIPYRLGYAAVAAFGFVPRFRRELHTIRKAQRARGIGTGPGLGARIRRQLATLVPLMAAALRHADRVALAMDARGFGYRSWRTERHPVPLRARDWWFGAGLLGAYAAAFIAGALLAS